MLGQIISGRYQIIEKLGKGGFGTTFIAEDSKLPGNPKCVVKQFSPQFQDQFALQIARRLFNQEAEVLQKLGIHDQIPRLLAYFEEAEQFYLVQELIEGDNVADLFAVRLIEKDRTKEAVYDLFSESEIIQILKDILEVLVFVQTHGVIHRDIKPSNLIKRNSDSKIVLIDFGSVKRISNQRLNEQGQVEPTVVVGTPGYMPCELLNGHPNLSSDIYATGMIGVQALTGILPNRLRINPRKEIIWRNQLNPHKNYNLQLLDILDKMVRYNSQERYQSASEALQALETLTVNLPPTIFISKQVKSGDSGAFKIPTTIAVIPFKSKFFTGHIFNKNNLIILTILSFIIAIASTILINFSLYQSQKNKWLNYQSSYGFTINYPENWDRQDQDSIFEKGTIFISPLENKNDSYRDNISILVEDLSSHPMSLYEYTNQVFNQIQKDVDPNVSKPQEATLANAPAMKIVYEKIDGNEKIKILEIWTLKRNKAYVVTYTAKVEDYPQKLNEIEKMIKSLQIIQ